MTTTESVESVRNSIQNRPSGFPVMRFYNLPLSLFDREEMLPFWSCHHITEVGKYGVLEPILVANVDGSPPIVLHGKYSICAAFYWNLDSVPAIVVYGLTDEDIKGLDRREYAFNK